MAKNKSKSEYNRRWYLANKSYKKTFSRLESRGLCVIAHYLALDRKRQVENGLWIDERYDTPYCGIC